MSRKTRVDVELVIELQKWRNRMNGLGLCEIAFYENDIELCVSSEAIERFGFTGLNNLDFITSGAYKGQ